MIHGRIIDGKEIIEVQLFHKLEHWNTFKYRTVKSIRAAKLLITRYVKCNYA